MRLTETLLHRWLAIPYTLHAQVRSASFSKKAPTVLFIHGIGNSGAVWKEVVDQLPPDLRIITIDLLGFGSSQRPPWAVYSAKTQARSVMATLVKLRITRPVIIVGHSLGALVAVEMAKRYPLLVRSLILCSPPFYKVDVAKRQLLPRSDTTLREIYMLLRKHPEQAVKIFALALRLGLINKTFNLTIENAPIYMNALESSIINQTSLNDAVKLSKPVYILYGRLDPVVVVKNLKFLKQANEHVVLSSVLAGHEVKGRAFISAVIRAVKTASQKSATQNRKTMVQSK